MVNALLVAGLCLIWGATWVAIKIGLSDSPPFYGAAFRFLIAAVVLAVMTFAGRRRLPTDRTVWRWMIFSGVLMYFGSYAVVYYTEQYINAGLAAILFASFPFFVAIGAHLHLPGERLTMLKVIGLIIGFVGVVIVTGGGLSGPGTIRWWAPILILLSPLFSAVASIVIKKYLTKDDPISVNFIQMAVGTAILFSIALSFEDISTFHWTSKSIGAMIFLALFGSVFTFVVYYHLLRTMQATKLALIAFVTPIVAAVIDWLILGATLSMATLGGAMLVLIGIWVVNIVRPKTAASEVPG